MTAPITHHGVTAWSVPAITDTPPTASTLPGSSLDLYAMATRRQYVPLSFCLRSTNRCTIRLSANDSDLDVALRWVKSWWQSPLRYGGKVPVMTPELLVYDPKTVEARDDKTNVVRSPLLDADRIEPLELAQNTTQQVWVVVRAPSGWPSSRYRVTIKVEVGNGGHWDAFEVPILIDVLPFELAPSPITRSVYYRSHRWGARDKDWRTEEQYVSELEDMAEHGVTHPIGYEPLTVLNETAEGQANIRRMLEMYREAGLSTDVLYSTKTPFYYYPDADFAAKKLRELIAFLETLGVEQLVCYGADEPTPEAMRRSLPLMLAMQECGAKNMTALIGNSADGLSILGSALDYPLFSDATVDLAPWKALGATVWKYQATTFVTKHDSHYRRFYGLDAKGWDGTAPYAYQDVCGPSWANDCDNLQPDHMLAYPLDGAGVIGTLQHEAIREGDYDLRYASAAEDLDIDVPEHSGNLDAWRDSVIRLILAKG